MQIEAVKLKLPFDNPNIAYVYLIDNEIVVDGGFCSKEHAEIIEELCDKVLITHHHIDHVGVVFFSEVEAFIHPLEKEFIEMYTIPNKFTEFYSRICRMFSIPTKYVEPIRIIDLMKLRIKAKLAYVQDLDLNVVHVPGHTPGHVCVLVDNCLISGDAIMSKTTPNIGYYPGFNIMEKYLRCLESLLGMGIEVIYPAHERPIYDVEDCISTLIEHYKSRIREVYELVGDESKTVLEISRGVRWSSGSFDKLDDFNKFLALSETLSCLEYLESRGMVKRVNGSFIRDNS